VQQGRNQGVGWENQSSLEKISGYVLAVQGWKKYFSRGVTVLFQIGDMISYCDICRRTFI
jgi:hypothetical protein